MYDLDKKFSNWFTELQDVKGANGCVLTADERFVIVFTQRIQIIDLYRQCLRKTDINCPKRSFETKTVIRNDKYSQDIITFGFIRNCWRDPLFRGKEILPVYLIKIIERYYYYQVIHLFCQKGLHWTISVDHIIWSLYLKMKKKHLNQWNCTDIVHWIETVNEGKLRRISGVDKLKQHIEIGKVTGNEISLINDVTLKMIGIDDSKSRNTFCKYFKKLLAKF